MKKSREFLYLAFLSTAISIGGWGTAPRALADPPPLVHTPSGDVSGLDLGDRVEFRGIPYAQPPTGDLRWKPSVPIQPWAGVHDGSQFGQYCTQPIGWDEVKQEMIVGGGEDCLFLNVAVPPGTVPETGFPVIVDIHGSDHTYGQGGQDTSNLVKNGVIVVTLNYRLGIFGYGAHPLLTSEGDGSSGYYALLDQMQALSWVKENIGSFGGNPNQVTATGHSSGAGDLVVLMASPLAKDKNLFQQAAPFAYGSGFVYMGINLPETEQIGLQVSENLGCDTAPDPLHCMRYDRTAAEVARAYGFESIPLTNDGKLLPKPTIDLLQENGSVPMLTGAGADEHGWIYYNSFYPNPMGTDELLMYIGDWIFVKYANEARRRFYNINNFGSNWQAYMHFETDLLTSCPMRAVALAPRARTYRYVFTRKLSFIENVDQIGAAHGTDMQLLWGETRDFQSPEDLALGEQMATYLANFAKTGDPNDPHDPGLPEWPELDPTNESYMEFGDAAIAHEDGGFRQQECNYLDSLPVLSLDCKHYMLCRWIDGHHMLNPRFLLQVGGFDRGRFGMEDKDVGRGRF